MIEPKQVVKSRNVADHYNELDSYYREIWGEHVHHGLWLDGDETPTEAVESLSHFVAERLHLKAGDHVCDIGCGYGATSQIFADEYEAHVLGLTISKQQFAVAKKRKARLGSLQFREQDWLKNDLPSESYEAAFSIESSEHMPDKKRFFSEAYRILKPGGHFVICAWCASESPSPIETKMLLEPICREGQLPSLLSPSEYLSYLTENGFTDIASVDVTKEVSRTWSSVLEGTIRHFSHSPSHLIDLLPGGVPSTNFLPSVLRIALAYRTGAMNYVVFSAKKPSKRQ